MATEEHKRLATTIKDHHESLRQLSKKIGPEQAWQEHLKDVARMQEYSASMYKLASIWEENTNNTELQARSRIQWVIDYCAAYFKEGEYLEKRQREQRQLNYWNEQDSLPCTYLKRMSSDSIRILDVGSCFNPFARSSDFKVTAIDLYPATDDVLRGDFLKVPVINTQEPVVKDGAALSLPCNYFECVVFSLLLEYIPNAEQRLECCRKSYKLLCTEGILIVITPDSQHVGKNAALMKNWRYTLATIGFSRIRFEKLPHITCMVFRKTINPSIAVRWSQLHREDYMSDTIEIPQDTK